MPTALGHPLPGWYSHLRSLLHHGVNALGKNERAKEALVVLALRKAPVLLRYILAFAKAKFQREILTKIPAQKRVIALLLLGTSDALVERGVDTYAHA